MRTRIGMALALGLCVLAGCGGGNGSAPFTPPGNNNAVTHKAIAGYTLTDLGAADYYYYGSSYYGLNRGATLAVNSAGQVVSSAGPHAVVWQNGTPTTLSDAYSSASDLNDNGQIVGQGNVNTTNWQWHAVLWQNGKATDLGTLNGNDPGSYGYSWANAINDVGQVVGSSTTSGWAYDGFLWQNGKMIDLGTLGGGYSTAAGINHSGQVVGWSSVAGSQYTYYPVNAFVWQNGKMTSLGTLPGGTSSDASAINDAGQIVGSSDSAPQGLYNSRPLRAVVWQNGTVVDLGTLGGPGSIAFDINNAGQIVGSANTSTVSNENPPFFWGGTGGSGASGGGPSPPGSGGGGTGGGTGSGAGGSGNGGNGQGNGNGNPINAGAGGGRAPAVKRGIGDTYVAHAFLYAGGQMYDLNNLIPANTGWELTQATGISESGQIAGYGVLNKRIHAFLLTAP